MTLRDWIRDSGYRFKTEPPGRAALKSTVAFVRGANRRVPIDVIPPVWERDWDVLVILDACRVDLMASVIGEYEQLPDEVGSVWSQAACSIDWIEKTFNQHPSQLEDCAYITANPFAQHDAPHAKSADLDHEAFADLRLLYQTEWREIGGIETVPPEWVTNHAIDAWRNRGQTGAERMIVHYMQPHEPYITRPEWSQIVEDDNPVLKNLVEDGYTANTSPWKAMVQEGPVSVEEFWPVYQDNLRWVLEDTSRRLLPNLDGQVVLSADHGNGLGEYGEWHHPPDAFSPYIRKVPWVEIKASDRRTIEPTIGSESVSSDVDAQLDALGYR